MTELFSNGYGLFIGVGADLPVTVKDAQALYNLFVDPARAAYDPQHVRILTEEQATRDAILTTLDEFAITLPPDATMIVYFSGHGGHFQSQEYFLLPNNYDAARREATTISGEVFTQKIEALKAKKLVVFLDCCHAGGMFDSKDKLFEKAPIPPTLLRILDSGKGQGIIASSLQDEKSYYDSSQSIFTACLLDALSGKALGKQDGFARFLNAIIYLLDEVPKRAIKQGPQHPFICRILEMSDNFPLCRIAGGSKTVPGVAIHPPMRGHLSLGKRRRLIKERNRLQQEHEIHSEMLRRLRNAWAAENDVAAKYKQELEWKKIETTLAPLDAKLDELDEMLEDATVEESANVTTHQKSVIPPESDTMLNTVQKNLLKEEEQQHLFELLCSIPNIEYATVRHSLVAGLPANFQVNIDFGLSCEDYIAKLMDLILHDPEFRLPNGLHPIMQVMRNAIKKCAERPIKDDLQYLLNVLLSRQAVAQIAPESTDDAETFLAALQDFQLQLPAVRYDLEHIQNYFDDYIIDSECEEVSSYLTEASALIPDFYNILKRTSDPAVTSHRLMLINALLDFNKSVRDLKFAIHNFCSHYGSVLACDQPSIERELIQQQLEKLLHVYYEDILRQADNFYEIIMSSI